MSQAIIPRLIGAIGDTNFSAVVADELARLLGFDLSAIVLHRQRAKPSVLFDDFDRVGGREGIANYVGVTHRINPILARAPRTGAWRARDFGKMGTFPNLRTSRPESAGREIKGSVPILLEAEEELGFRTAGWPRRMEEVGLYVQAWGGIVELGFYRERGRCSASTRKLRALNELSAPLAAAFDKHAVLSRRDLPTAAMGLSPREQEICALLLAGCSSQAIALRLDISRHTVKDHRKAIFRKLRIGSLAELFALQARAGQ